MNDTTPPAHSPEPWKWRYSPPLKIIVIHDPTGKYAGIENPDGIPAIVKAALDLRSQSIRAAMQTIAGNKDDIVMDYTPLFAAIAKARIRTP